MTREQQIAAEVAARYGCPVPDTAVQVLPVGKSAWQAPVWDPKINQLRYPDAEARQRSVQAAHYIRARKVAASQAAEDRAARRAEVARLHAEGLWVAEMARRLGVDPNTVNLDLSVLGLEPIKAPPSAFVRRSVPPEVLARNARIAELAAQGWSADQIGLDVGFSRRVVKDVAAKLGVEIRRPERVKATPKVRPKVERPGVGAAIAARREVVRGLIEAGEYAMEIARRLGIAPRTVVGDARAMGLTLPKGRAIAKPQSEAAAMIHRLRSERRERVARLNAQGLSIAAISRAIGIAPRTVRQDLQSQGLKYISAREVLARGRAGRTIAILSKIAARDLKLRTLVAEGRRATEICAALGIAESTVRRDLSRLGLRIAESNALEQRRERVARMRADGATIPQMAQALGVSPAAISSDIAALGLAGKSNSPKRMAA